MDAWLNKVGQYDNLILHGHQIPLEMQDAGPLGYQILQDPPVPEPHWQVLP